MADKADRSLPRLRGGTERDSIARAKSPTRAKAPAPAEMREPSETLPTLGAANPATWVSRLSHLDGTARARIVTDLQETHGNRTTQRWLSASALPTSQAPSVAAAAVQRAAPPGLLPAPAETDNLTKLRQLLKDDKENPAIDLMGKLSPAEVAQVLGSDEFKKLAISAFNNAEMYRGVRAMHGDLFPSLDWMFDEGTDWDKVRDVITRAPSGHDRVRASNRMKDEFVSLCNNKEMAEAVDLLGGTLLQKLSWMKAEGSDWGLVRAKIAETKDAAQKTELYSNGEMLAFFVDVCNNKEMAEAVGLLGGTLLQKLWWMLAEGTDVDLVSSAIRTTPADELPVVAGNKHVMDGLRKELSSGDFQTVQRMLTQGLLFREKVKHEEPYTKNVFDAWLTMTRNGVTLAKEVQFVEKGTFAPGAFDALKQRALQAVTTYLSGKFKIKVQSPGGTPQVGDGEYPITVKLVDNPKADYEVKLLGGEHGRSSAGESSAHFYELGQDNERSLPDITLGHEAGHMILGASDEYADAEYPARPVFTDHSLMGDFYTEGMATAEIKARHFQHLVAHVSKYFPGRNISIVR